MKLTPIVYGRTTLPESMIFEGSESDARRPIALRIYLIECDGRKILVDAGCDTMPGFEVSHHVGPVRALADIGASALDITDIILTHHHHDHAECIGSFPNAVLYLHSDEYEPAKKYIPTDMRVITFDESVEVCAGVRAIRIGGHTKGSSIVSVTLNDKEYIISGDECYLSECLELGIATGVSQDASRSRKFIEKYSDDKYNVLVMHEP